MSTEKKEGASETEIAPTSELGLQQRRAELAELFSLLGSPQ
jgi:hypothetical protein